MISVLYDHQIFDNQTIGGISRYFYNLSRYIPSTISCKYTDNAYILADDNYKTIKRNQEKYKHILGGMAFKGRHKIYCLLNKASGKPQNPNLHESQRRLTEGAFDVFHPTYYDPYFLPYLNNKPFVLTIHDMIHEKYPEFFPNDNWTKPSKELLAKKADRIIAISESTKYDIVEFLDIPEGKIDVIHHGINSPATTPKPEHLELPPQYLLYTGTRSNYKNFPFMAESLASLILERDIPLICTGPAFNISELNYIETLGIKDKVIHLHSDDNTLYHLYRNASLFIFPSYYEGFGIPILEAFICRCPTLLANISCFKEIAKDGALYFDPKSKRDLTQKTLDILDNDSIKDSLVSKGEAISSLMTCQSTAQKTLECYNQAINDRKNKK